MSITLVRCTVVSCAFNHCHFTAGLSPPLHYALERTPVVCQSHPTDVIQSDAPSGAVRSIAAGSWWASVHARPCVYARVSVAPKRRAIAFSSLPRLRCGAPCPRFRERRTRQRAITRFALGRSCLAASPRCRLPPSAREHCSQATRHHELRTQLQPPCGEPLCP
jgi:hypothetical protein